MNLQKMLEFQKRMEQELGDIESDEIGDYLDEAGEYLNEKAEQGKKIVTQRMSEEKFVRLIREVDGIVGGAIGSPALLMARMTGELQPYIHTMLLAIIAILVEEEVL